MKLRHPFLIRLFGMLAAWLIRLWMGTVRHRLVFPDGRVHPTDARRERFLYACWHENILFITKFHGARVKVMISQHADGEFIAQACRHLRVGVVRGSSTRGGTEALLQMHRASRDAHLLVTPDGPKGPRQRVQAGLIFLASSTGLPIITCGVGYARAWRFPSWDRFAVPWPWTLTVCVVAPPVYVPPELNRRMIDHYRKLVEERFQEATAAAERLAQGRSRIEPATEQVEPIRKASA